MISGENLTIMFIFRSPTIRCGTIIFSLLLLTYTFQMLFFGSFIRYFSSLKDRTFKQLPPKDSFTDCLLRAENAFRNLSLPWFLAFGTALMYYRSNNFISDDIDIGIFFHHLRTKNITDHELTSTLEKYDFRILMTYGRMNDGQGWTLQCPTSETHFGIFVFYSINFQTISTKSYKWWTASYNGPCAKMLYKKCRKGFTEIELHQFDMYGKSFNIVSKQFLIDQYGSQWIIPRNYTYFESIRLLTNLIDKR